MIELSRGLNPHETATVEPIERGRPSFELLRGRPSYINVLDALGAWEAVLTLQQVTGLAACASFKHTSPAGIALAREIVPGDEVFADDDPSPATALGTAILRARRTAPKSSNGDFVAVSEPVDDEVPYLANAIGVIAPSFSERSVERLARYNHGQFIILRGSVDALRPSGDSPRTVVETGGMRLARTGSPPDSFAGGTRVEHGSFGDPLDLAVAVVTVRHAQSNAMAFVKNAATTGIGMGQQNRLDCTRLAAFRSAVWQRRCHPDIRALRFLPGLDQEERAVWRARLAEEDFTPSVRREFAEVLADWVQVDSLLDWSMTPQPEGLTLAADNHFPFVEVVELAARHGVTQMVTPEGCEDPEGLRQACAEHDISWVVTGERFFRH